MIFSDIVISMLGLGGQRINLIQFNEDYSIFGGKTFYDVILNRMRSGKTKTVKSGNYYDGMQDGFLEKDYLYFEGDNPKPKFSTNKISKLSIMKNAPALGMAARDREIEVLKRRESKVLRGVEGYDITPTDKAKLAKYRADPYADITSHTYSQYGLSISNSTPVTLGVGFTVASRPAISKLIEMGENPVEYINDLRPTLLSPGESSLYKIKSFLTIPSLVPKSTKTLTDPSRVMEIIDTLALTGAELDDDVVEVEAENTSYPSFYTDVIEKVKSLNHLDLSKQITIGNKDGVQHIKKNGKIGKLIDWENDSISEIETNIVKNIQDTIEKIKASEDKIKVDKGNKTLEDLGVEIPISKEHFSRSDRMKKIAQRTKKMIEEQSEDDLDDFDDFISAKSGSESESDEIPEQTITHTHNIDDLVAMDLGNYITYLRDNVPPKDIAEYVAMNNDEKQNSWLQKVATGRNYELKTRKVMTEIANKYNNDKTSPPPTPTKTEKKRIKKANDDIKTIEQAKTKSVPSTPKKSTIKPSAAKKSKKKVKK